MDDIRSISDDSDWSRGGRIPGNGESPAFVLHVPRPAPVPILIAVPHAGRDYPVSLKRAMRHPAESSLRLEDRYVDLIASTVARETGACLLVARAPRAMIDLNRSPEDIDWDMVAGGPLQPGQVRHAAGRRARSGLGLVPRRLPGLGELWRQRLRTDDISERVEWVHQPYHLALAATLETLRDRWGRALLLDLHSMPPLGPKDGSEPVADIVLGDRFGASCEGRFISCALDYLDSTGRRGAHNRPYAGGYVLDRHGAPSRGVSAMQVEICRATYLDSQMREPGVGLDSMTALMTGLVRRLADEIASDGQNLAHAAE